MIACLNINNIDKIEKKKKKKNIKFFLHSISYSFFNLPFIINLAKRKTDDL